MAPVRGETLTCWADPIDFSASVSYSWTFTPSDFTLPGVQKDGGSSWSGVLVAGGVVAVTAQDTVNSDSATVRVHVWKRDWFTSFKRQAGFTFNLPIVVTSDALGLNTSALPPFVSSFWQVLEGKGESKLAEVVGGPNDGYWYVESHNYAVDRLEWVNSRLTAGVAAEIPDGGVTVNAWTYLASRGFTPQLTQDGAWAHEGMGGPLGPNGKGHSGQMQKANTASACGDAAALAEPIVGSTESEVDDAVKDVEYWARRTFSVATDHHFVYGNYPPNAALVLFDSSAAINPGTNPGTNPRIVPGIQDQQIFQVVPQPPGCTWSNF